MAAKHILKSLSLNSESNIYIRRGIYSSRSELFTLLFKLGSHFTTDMYLFINGPPLENINYLYNIYIKFL